VPWLEPPGPQSVIAERVPVEPVLPTAPFVSDEPLAVELPDPAVVPLGPDFDAMLPGPQSVLLLPKVLELGGFGLALLAPVLVCASAAVPSVKAAIEAAVRSSRCILVSSCWKYCKNAPCPLGRSWETAPPEALFPLNAAVAQARQSSRPRRRKKKGRTEVRPKFREEKPEGLAMGSGEPARIARVTIGW